MRQFLLVNWTFIICPKGTTVWSDRWAAYVNLTAVTGSAHATLNHSVAVVAPNGVHTNGVENLWRCAKDKFKRMRGTSDELIASYLDEFLRHRMAGDRHLCFQRALELIREYYPVWISLFNGSKQPFLGLLQLPLALFAHHVSVFIRSFECLFFIVSYVSELDLKAIFNRFTINRAPLPEFAPWRHRLGCEHDTITTVNNDYLLIFLIYYFLLFYLFINLKKLLLIIYWEEFILMGGVHLVMNIDCGRFGGFTPKP